jgi:acyl carrier protein
MDEVTADTMAIIAKRLPADRHALSMTDRLEDLGIDSFTAVEMIFDLEEKFDVQISWNANESMSDFVTVGDVVAAMKKLVGRS